MQAPLCQASRASCLVDPGIGKNHRAGTRITAVVATSTAEFLRRARQDGPCRWHVLQAALGYDQTDMASRGSDNGPVVSASGTTAIALLCRRWLSADEGDSPIDAQATVWLDLKRIYMTLRPRLRRVYLTVCDLPAYASVAERLGFEVLSDRGVELDGVMYHSAMLDFGPASVDGWLSDIAAAELGIHHAQELLDVGARELVLEEGRVALTRWSSVSCVRARQYLVVSYYRRCGKRAMRAAAT